MKKITILLISVGIVFVFSGCSLIGKSNNNSNSSSSDTIASKKTANLIKSIDGGKNWENKIKITDTANIGSVNVLSMAVDTKGFNTVYVGTEKDGLFLTRNGGDSWEKLSFPLEKIYGIALDNNNSQIVYASGIFNKRAKIYKSLDAGKNWIEIYTEPANDTVISSLEINKRNPSILYAGTSEGIILKTTDGGQTWKNVFKANGPVISIAFDAINDSVAYFAVFNGTVLRTMDNGKTTEDLSNLKSNNNKNSTNPKLNSYSLAVDPRNSGVFYVGTSNGMFKSSNFGTQWSKVDILESSKSFPIRSIAINPSNPDNILYGVSGVIYQSSDGGNTWLTSQLNTSNSIQTIYFDQNNPGVVYAGLRKN